MNGSGTFLANGRNQHFALIARDGISGSFDMEAAPFPHENHGEDQTFANTAVAHFTAAGKQDRDYSCVHVIHASNTSFCYPQQIWRKDQVAHLFHGFS